MRCAREPAAGLGACVMGAARRVQRYHVGPVATGPLSGLGTIKMGKNTYLVQVLRPWRPRHGTSSRPIRYQKEALQARTGHDCRDQCCALLCWVVLRRSSICLRAGPIALNFFLFSSPAHILSLPTPDLGDFAQYRPGLVILTILHPRPKKVPPPSAVPSPSAPSPPGTLLLLSALTSSLRRPSHAPRPASLTTPRVRGQRLPPHSSPRSARYTLEIPQDTKPPFASS